MVDVTRNEQHQGVQWDNVRDEAAKFDSLSKTNVTDATRPRQTSSASKFTTLPTVFARLTEIAGRYDGYISSYVDKCPFHLFDTERKRNISRSELKDDIATSLMSWIKIPLTCGEIMDAISNLVPSCIQPKPYGWQEEVEESIKALRPYVFSAMTKNPLIDDEEPLISALNDELYHSMRRMAVTIHPTPMSMDSILLAVRKLIDVKRSERSIPSHRVHEQIEQFGQYAILSHRWQDGQELSFADVANFSHPSVQEKEGFEKLAGLSRVVKSHYGCRYLWVDTACIDETDRNRSIPLMFGWYRHAYVCVIYLSTSTRIVSQDPWSTRGWTLQEFLAARRIKCFIGDWRPVDYLRVGTVKFHACRESKTFSPVYWEIRRVAGDVDWEGYKPGMDQAIRLLHAMRTRKTTRPEDMVYCLLSALNIDIPVEYGEGFDRAFYRLQVKYLTQTNNRRLLSWRGGASSPYNSMLAGGFKMSEIATRYRWRIPENMSLYPYDPTISFDSNGVMRIMVSLHLLHTPTSSAQPQVLALMGETINVFLRMYVGVLLRRLPGQVYQRIGLKECKKSEISMEVAPEWVFIK